MTIPELDSPLQNLELLREQKLRDIEENLLSAISDAKVIKLTNDEIKQMLIILLEEDIDEQRT